MWCHPDSFRAEAYGMLAVLCYLARLADFTVTPDQQWTGEVATDSQSLLDAISFKPTPLSVPVQACTERRLKDIQAIDVLSPEWDLVSNIVHILTKFPGLYLQYVWGHQDKKMAYHQLSLLAQLNEDEDAMASRYQQQHAQTHTFSPTLRASASYYRMGASRPGSRRTRNYAIRPPMVRCYYT